MHLSIRPARNASSGFTLVELLVVMGVIALLVALLLPSLAKARQSALRVKCMANLQQIGYAFQIYMNLNPNTLDSPTNLVVETLPTGTWFREALYGRFHASTDTYDATQGFLSPYCKNPLVSVCPSFTYDDLPISANTSNPLQISYGDYGPSDATGLNGLKLMRDPSETVAWADAAMVTTDSNGNPVLGRSEALAQPSLGLPTFHGRHLKRGNVLWFDGHVSSVAPYIPAFPIVSPGVVPVCKAQWLGFLTPVPQSVSPFQFDNQAYRDFYFQGIKGVPIKP
jgi:prepilin-type processing-associated H-X9-DG protein/prepilin-type N-terminal cleavage/methylation domain-containing protein